MVMQTLNVFVMQIDDICRCDNAIQNINHRSVTQPQHKRRNRSRPTAATTPQPGRPSAMDTVATYTNTIETRIGTSLQLSDGNCKFPSHGFRMAYSEERVNGKMGSFDTTLFPISLVFQFYWTNSQ